MKAILKKCIGKALIEIADFCPSSKGLLKPLGMRASLRLFPAYRAVRVQTPDARNLRLTNVSTNYLSLQLFWKGSIYYEPLTTLLLQELLQPGATFVDVGANIGFFSLMAALSTPGIEVIAFEPNPKNFSILEENVRANGLEKIVNCEPLAISNKEGTATLYLNTSDMSASLTPDFQTGFNPAVKSVAVTTETLDGYFDKHVSGDRLVLKIDVEGHETSLLRGAQRVLAAYGPDIIIEVIQPYPDEICAVLRGFGYEFYRVNDLGLVRSEKMDFERRGDFCFLNYLLSKRSKAEISQISEKIATRAKQIDFRQTSKYFGKQTQDAASAVSSPPPSGASARIEGYAGKQ